MKIYKNIFEKITSLENLLDAWIEFKKGKTSKYDVQLFERNLEKNLFSLHRRLVSKKYNHNAYSEFYIRDPKVRQIHKATVEDRIVHHLLFQIINPIFEPTFIPSSYSCRKEKGAHKAVNHLVRSARKVSQNHGRCFVLKCDIRKFFHTINHELLLEIIGEKIKDTDAMWLVRNVIESFSSEFSSEEDIKGTPIGNLTSQLFVNIYMNRFDQFVKHKLKIKHYIRYTDDFAVVHQNEDYLWDMKNKMESFLENELKLSLHPEKVCVRKYSQGIDFLGYVVLPKVKLLRTKTKRRMMRKMKLKAKRFVCGEVSEESLFQSFNSYLGILSHADCHGLREKLHHKLWEWTKQKGTADLLPTLTETPRGSNCGGATAPSSLQLDTKKQSPREVFFS
jgi:retron-type reverse transcriptase